MAFWNPTYDGNSIFGLAVRIQVEPNPTAQQIDAFFGVNGNIALFGGARGTMFLIDGVLYGADLSDLNSLEGLFQPSVPGNYADGIARTLIDTRGRTWENVIYAGRFQPDAMGPKYFDGGIVLPYKTAFQSLT